MVGGFFVPLFSIPQAYASFLSSILGDEVYAKTDTADLVDSGDNSRTIVLPQVNVSPASVFEDQNNPLSDDININTSDGALVPEVSFLSTVRGAGRMDIGGPFFDQVSVYVVRKGDSLSAIAQMFDVSVNTILAANDMKKGDKLKEGDVLFILPISGLEHTVVKGETLQSIAKLYKADINDIALYNGISLDTKLAIGDELIIPGGDMIDEGGDTPAPNLGLVQVKDKNYYDTHPIRSVAGYFINPLPTGRKTQGLHGPGHRGIDIGAPKGTPIYASAEGTVLIAKTGWSGGYGNMAIIQHPNGTKTLYAHMTKLGTSTGAQVKQGQIIGYVGSTGRSTGPHLHFEVFNAKNPGADWSWKQ